MALFVSGLRLLNHHLYRLFGGEEARRQANDMMRRLASVYTAVALIFAATLLPGLVHYHWESTVTLLAAGVFYNLALVRPQRSVVPELASMVFWTLGVACSLLSAWIAGPPYAYLWAGSAVTLPFVAVIWPPRVTVMAVASLMAGVITTGLLVAPGEIAHEPPTLVGPVLAMIFTAVMASSVREVDRRHRAAVITDSLTGLGNRAAMALYARERFGRARQVFRSRWSCSTSTTSRRSTTGSATRRGTLHCGARRSP